jgi:hypothetical protein
VRPFAIFAVSLACGYQPLYANSQGMEAYHVHLSKNQTASAVVAEEVVRGVRDALAKEGALAAGDGFPRIEVEVLRADETSEGIVQAQEIQGTEPRARATDLAVVARAAITRRAGGASELDTGDMRAEDLTGAPLDDPNREAWAREDALRAAARRLGGRIALRILGHPVVTTP